MTKGTLIVLFLMAGAFRLEAQQKISLDSILRVLPDSFPQENVYLHLDKDRYMSGDTVWFKGYLTSGGFPGGVSTGLHVELFGPSGARMVSKLFPVLGGRVSLGDLELKDSLPQGLYTIRAYTDWMSNFDPAFFYHFTFPLYATTLTPVKERPVKGKAPATAPPRRPAAPAAIPPGIDIQFLPEGGDQVQDVLSTIAFRATDQHGLPVDVSGKIVDDLDTTVVEFKTVHDGMGLFQMTPWKRRTYTAVVETPLGERRVALPTPRPEGVVINTRTDAKGVGFILRTDSGSRYIGKPLQVLGTEYGQTVFRARTTLSAELQEISGFIPTTTFVPGVMTITVLTEGLEPLAERAVFIRPYDIRKPATLSLDTVNTDPKGFNAWNLHFSDTTKAYLSVSVTDADALQPDPDRTTILTGLLLNGNLQGNVYHPAFYFRDTADSTEGYLDLVMRTHGWRRFDWKALAQGQFPAIHYQDKNYLSFEGQAMDESGKKPVVSTSLTVILKSGDSTQKLILTQLDSSGNFTLDGLVFFDTASAYYQLNRPGMAGKNVRLQLRPDPSFPLDTEAVKGVAFPSASTDTAFVGKGNREADLLAGLRRLQKAKEIQEIVIKGHKKTPLEELEDRYANGVFAGGIGGAYAFDVINDKTARGYPDILTYLQGKVPGLTIASNPAHTTLRFRGKGQPQLFLDEIPTDVTMIMAIPVADIAYIKFIDPPFVGATGGGPNGALAVYTRKGGDQTSEIDGLNRFVLKGYSPIRQFYQPAYDQKDTAASAFPDYRITLDWNPFLFYSTKTTSIPIRFYNNDACKHFRIVAEGMDENGRLLHLEQVVGK
jgi:hypothetical protein